MTPILSAAQVEALVQIGAEIEVAIDFPHSRATGKAQRYAVTATVASRGRTLAISREHETDSGLAVDVEHAAALAIEEAVKDVREHAAAMAELHPDA